MSLGQSLLVLVVLSIYILKPVVIRDVWEVLWALVQLYLLEEALYTDALNKRCFSWSNDVLQLRLEAQLSWGHVDDVDRPGDATNSDSEVKHREIFK